MTTVLLKTNFFVLLKITKLQLRKAIELKFLKELSCKRKKKQISCISFSSFFSSRNGSSFKGTLIILKQPASLGREKSKRWKVSVVKSEPVEQWNLVVKWRHYNFQRFRSLWVICGFLFHLPALDVRHEPGLIWFNIWTCGHPRGEIMLSC